MNTVGIVLVSHSLELAAGLRKLILQMEPDVAVATAGGTDEGEIGTSIQKIKSAISSIASDQGVLVLFDVGSALMSTEMAIEMVLEEGSFTVQIADAPLVEGALAAVVEAACGSSLEEVKRAAEEAKQMIKI